MTDPIEAALAKAVETCSLGDVPDWPKGIIASLRMDGFGITHAAVPSDYAELVQTLNEGHPFDAPYWVPGAQAADAIEALEARIKGMERGANQLFDRAEAAEAELVAATKLVNLWKAQFLDAQQASEAAEARVVDLERDNLARFGKR